MKLSGWGNYPKINAEIYAPVTQQHVINHIVNESHSPLIARGLGRSYGDSSLASHVIDTSYLDHFLDFDPSSGMLSCAAGVSLADILKCFVPKGWFLPVTPGTKFITVGGAIASDVHGKNHHVDGSFCDHLDSFTIALASGEVVRCSRNSTDHAELFYATCGGMGLTGIVLEARFKLKPIKSSSINEVIIKAKNLEEVLDLLDAHGESTYSVAWIDCISTGKSLGRSLLMLGEHTEEGDLTIGKDPKLAIPFNMPSVLLNRFSIQAFNALYYHRVRKQQSNHIVHYEPFFYPLDFIHHWNKMYGKTGFTQYQFVLPKKSGYEGMREILQCITQSKRGSFLAVLKAFGRGNENYLTFPMEGYTLALDFKLGKGLFNDLDEFDKIIQNYGGRLYLAKDVRMSETMFKQSYPKWEAFAQVRRSYGADRVFNSLQSQRLGI